MSLADDLEDSYLAWREASAQVQSAYEAWADSDICGREAAFGSYVIALEREHHAARDYQTQVDRVCLEAEALDSTAA